MGLVFVSYSRQDSGFAARLRNDLIRNGIQVWRDQEDIPKGVNWDNAIEEILLSGQVSHVVVVLSKTASESENVKDEIDLALNSGIEYIIPVLIEDCKIPMRIRRRNYVDFRTDYEQPFRQLLECLRRDLQPRVIIVEKELRPPTTTPTQEQISAAHDTSQLIRLVAGPGTGKSLVIEERVRWLLSNHVSPDSIYVISFTRAASRDLRRRIVDYCRSKGVPDARKVSVTTLHSLALRVLRKARLLEEYAVDPQVLDNWELENVFDAEFSEDFNCKRTRAEEVRLAFEAFWSTGQWTPPNYIRPEKPVTDQQKRAFTAFYAATSQTYACVLPGEIIKKCVERIEAGLLNPGALLGMKYLIVDEYQDLNNVDLRFVEAIIRSGISTFVAGDDDQSIYSFRYASPTGIRKFTERYREARDHRLSKCFRCTPEILETSQVLINEYLELDSIPKTLVTFYGDTQPALAGFVQRWRFCSDRAEAKAIAQSCKLLVDKGIKAGEILILISNRRIQLAPLLDAFRIEGIDVELPPGNRYVDEEAGRLAYAIVRIACDTELKDYVAHRLLLGLLKGIGIGTCNSIRRKIVEKSLNYLDVLYDEDIPDSVFSNREVRAIKRVRTILGVVTKWEAKDTIDDHVEDIADIIKDIFDEDATQKWHDYIAPLPGKMSLEELRAFMATDNREQQVSILEEVYERLQLEIPDGGVLPSRARIMTMHGAKGLNAQVVFIPGLEERILPGEKKKRYPALVFEAARMLYVSITRARAACILSYAENRLVHGSFGRTTPSRFVSHLNGSFDSRKQGLQDDEAEEVLKTIEFL